MPMLPRKLVGRNHLEFLCSARPPIEVVPSVTLRGDQHIFRPLTMRVAIKTHVLSDEAENRSRTELIFIVQANGHATLIKIIGSGLGNECADVYMLLAERKCIYRDHKNVIG